MHPLALCRCEAERVLLQQQGEVLQEQVHQLQQGKAQLQGQLQAQVTAMELAAQQLQQAQGTQAAAEATRARAVAEYRSNEIICIGLRDSIWTLQQHLARSQAAASQQVQHGCTHAGTRFTASPSHTWMSRHAACPIRCAQPPCMLHLIS